ncbi:unnamed protein product, partial [Ectocarpus sp. 8 AP-2014]
CECPGSVSFAYLSGDRKRIVSSVGVFLEGTYIQHVGPYRTVERPKSSRLVSHRVMLASCYWSAGLCGRHGGLCPSLSALLPLSLDLCLSVCLSVCVPAPLPPCLIFDGRFSCFFV